MTERMIYENFAPLFGEWADMFRPFIEGEEMWNIYQKLKKSVQVDKRFIVPSSDRTFRVFTETSPSNLKSIWYLMDPYPRRYKGGIDQATGVAMDCSSTPDKKIQPSLDMFYDGINNDLSIKCERSPNLSYLSQQGVMLINTDLTCELNKTSSHARLWEPFQKFFLEEIMGKRTGMIYILSGETSKRMEKYIIPLGNHIFKIEHPASAFHKHIPWKHNNVFSKTNRILADDNLVIEWDKKVWDENTEECPF